MIAKQVKFLGHLVSGEGIQPDPSIAGKILSCKAPRDRIELESFLGLVNFFGRMIPNFAELVAPLHRLRRQGAPFAWNPQHQAAFDNILKRLAAPPVLQGYSLQHEATVTTDASENAIAGVLTQNGKPVMYVSRALTSAERNYSNIEREGLAVVWSLLRMRQLLIGRKFTLVTDHKPLLAIYGGVSLPKVSAARMVRWAIILQQFDFRIKYQSGSSIGHADAFSRLRFACDESTNVDRVINNVSDDMVCTEFVHRIRNQMLHDTTAQSVLQRVRSCKWNGCSQREKAFFHARQALKEENGCLLLGSRLFVPTSLLKDMFDSAHQLHTGQQSTLRRLCACVWWPGMKSDVQRWIINCGKCNLLRPRLNKDLASWPAARPLERLHADWCHVPGVGNVLVFIDAASGWIEASLKASRATDVVISALSEWCSRFGVPKFFVTDNAPEFVSTELNKWCAANGIEKKESPPYHAASNGSAERAVQTVKRCMKAWRMETTHLSFGEYLKRVLFHHRTCSRRKCGQSPAELVFGRAIRLPLSANFAFGEKIVYSNNHSPPKELTHVMQRGSNTSWLLDEASGRLLLAHANQMAPATVTPGESPHATKRKTTTASQARYVEENAPVVINREPADLPAEEAPPSPWAQRLRPRRDVCYKI